MLDAYLELVIASFIFGSGGVFVKILNLPPTTLTFFRVLIPTLSMFIYLYFKGVRFFRGKVGWMMIASGINAIRLLLWIMSYTFTSIGNAALVQSVGPAFILIYSGIFFHEKFTRQKLMLVTMSVIGVIILYSNKPISFSNSDFLGMTLGLISSALYNLGLVIFKKEALNYSPAETVFYQNLVGPFIFLPFLFINPLPQLWQTALASAQAFLIGALAFLLYFSALRKVPAYIVSLATFDNVIGVIFGVVIFKEVLTGNMILGGLLVLLASYLTRGLI